MIDTVKLVICDIDGTLLDDKRVLTPRTKAVIQEMHKQGILFGVASGRPMDELRYNAKLWNIGFEFDVVIGYNGAQLYNGLTGTSEEYFTLKKEWVREIFDLMRPFESIAMAYVDDYIMVDKMEDIVKKSMKSSGKPARVAKNMDEFYNFDHVKLMFRVNEGVMDELEAYLAQHHSEHYAWFKTQTTLMEFMDRRISKGYALEIFSQQSGIPLSEIVAFGDMSNDITLLSTSGWGVCLVNGSDDTKAVADDITEYSNNEDGFAKYCEEKILNLNTNNK